ncbi:Hypothetical predicted protein [Lecanosticta acicola]|uniref:S-adenosyl-L-methionine-dependent methyltransferase n=1 Tax=Lecanosticta acicola TaxID=111012 RepID=A0AAI8YSU2_9PEZI|nr:Hypothetical predicted protein [Lecanosticta acicola]
MAEPSAAVPAGSSPNAAAAESFANEQAAEPVQQQEQQQQQQVVDDGASTVDPLEVDLSSDSGFADDDIGSDTTSLASSLIRGHVENGRKYSTLRDDYWGPSDDQQFETMDAGHLMYLLMEGERDNLLYRAPVDNPKYVLDIGTGTGTWAIDVADKFPDASVYGVDLYPPPNTWVPPNCHLEVEDVILGDWSFRKPFDLIHMRLLLGAFTDAEWDRLYGIVYDNLRPGGWIEQVELDVRVMSDDETLPKDSLLAGWGDNFLGCAERSGRPLSTQETMCQRIANAGFVNLKDDLFRCPLGTWPKDKRMKEAGRVNFHHWSAGLDGWAMWLLTKHGAPEPWSADEVRVYVAGVRNDLKKKGMHIYHLTRRVWAQKPLL